MTAGLSACATPQLTTRNAPFETVPTPGAQQVVAQVPTASAPDIPQRPVATNARLSIADYEIKMPQSLTVSEANLFYPVADIVWRGDKIGNRKQQIGAIFQESITRAKPNLNGDQGVKLSITLNRFHSITEKTRYTVGGVHSISFFVTATDASTGEVLINNRKVKADLEAYGGLRAINAEKQGLTMKERLHRHLARVIAAELTLPNGWADMDRQLERAVDQI
ncbi:DUF6778 family protein [Thalassococcus lentus]|uniref:Lipoprotein n=1 Tax=Thalassococcus lentus TaxID=1210524 RepID=A0ABT4XR20_9RHOB|nr:DUF6778 family protein [Thalassococcus lentus]MDA7424392.1 hypothetical protein [Thalassococcus lentus]